MRVSNLSCKIVYTVMYYVYFYFFFYKQKTAYEMRISDWSSDVCSSDLRRDHWHGHFRADGRSRAKGRSRHDVLVHHRRFRLRGRGALLFGTVVDGSGVQLRLSLHLCGDGGIAGMAGQIGSASCRERVCLYVSISVGAACLNKTKNKKKD